MKAGEVRLRVAKDGSVMVPAEVRRELGLEAGGEVILVREEGGYRLTARPQRIEEAQKHLRRYVKPGDSVVDELIAERREAAKRE